MGEPKAEKPIPFSSPMVRAQRAGLKTQTRRCPKLRELQPSSTPGYDWTFRDRRLLWHDVSHARLLELAPYQVGDLLWVREPLRPATAHRIGEDHGVGGYDAVSYDADGAILEDATWCPIPWPWRARYIASRYCPRWASRTMLEVLSVRVERVQSITEEDAIAEGMAHRDAGADRYGQPLPGWSWRDPHPVDADPFGGWEHCLGTARHAFGNLWNEINGKRPGCSWAANPWVWVVGFGPAEVRS